jgi:hypothetical protein
MMMVALPLIWLQDESFFWFSVIVFIKISSDIRKKLLEGFCRMVSRPFDYMKSFPDPDHDTFNFQNTKKDKIENMPDVNFAHEVAAQFVRKLNLNVGATLSMKKKIIITIIFFQRVVGLTRAKKLY